MTTHGPPSVFPWRDALRRVRLLGGVVGIAATRDRGPPLRDWPLSLDKRAPSRPSFGGVVGIAATRDRGPPLRDWPLSLDKRAPSRPPFGRHATWGLYGHMLCAGDLVHKVPGCRHMNCGHDRAWPSIGFSLEGRAPSRPPFGWRGWDCGHEGPWPSIAGLAPLLGQTRSVASVIWPACNLGPLWTHALRR